MHPVSKIDRRGDTRQVDDVPIGGKNVDAVWGDIAGEAFAQVAKAAHFVLPLQYLAQPGDFLFVAAALGVGIVAFIAPVGTHPKLCLVVHGKSADLNLQHLVFRPEYRRMQRLVAVFLGVGNVVVKLVGNVVPAGVDNPQYGVAVGDFRHQNTHGAYIVHLREVDPFAFHFAPDGVDVLGSTTHVVTVNVLRFHQAFEGFDDVVNIAVAIKALLRQ